MPIVATPSPAISFAVKVLTSTGRNQVQRNTGTYNALYLVPGTGIVDTYVELLPGKSWQSNNISNFVVSTSGPIALVATLANGSSFTSTIAKMLVFDDLLTAVTLSNTGTATVRISLNYVNVATVAALPFVFYGTAIAAPIDADFVQGLQFAVATDKNQTVTVNALQGETIYYCYPVINGLSTFQVNGLTGGMSIVGIVTLATPTGDQQYYVYGSDNTGLGTTTLIVGG